MKRSGIRESPGFRPDDGLHPGYRIFVRLLKLPGPFTQNVFLHLAG
jgi:hypothetical protein